MSTEPDRSEIGPYLEGSLGEQYGMGGLMVKVGFGVGRTKSKNCFHDRRPIPSEHNGFVCVVPGVSPRAGMPCPVGALRIPSQPHCVAQLGGSEFNDNYSSPLAASGTLAVARLGGEHHTHSRTAQKPILPRAS